MNSRGKKRSRVSVHGSDAGLRSVGCAATRAGCRFLARHPPHAGAVESAGVGGVAGHGVGSPGAIHGVAAEHRARGRGHGVVARRLHGSGDGRSKQRSEGERSRVGPGCKREKRGGGEVQGAAAAGSRVGAHGG
jgi:hypothetical protein